MLLSQKLPSQPNLSTLQTQGIPSGTTPPVSNAWINDLGISFVDNNGNVLVFEP